MEFSQVLPELGPEGTNESIFCEAVTLDIICSLGIRYYDDLIKIAEMEETIRRECQDVTNTWIAITFANLWGQKPAVVEITK